MFIGYSTREEVNGGNSRCFARENVIAKAIDFHAEDKLPAKMFALGHRRDVSPPCPRNYVPRRECTDAHPRVSIDRYRYYA